MTTLVCNGDPAYAPKEAGAFKRGTSNIQNWIDPRGEHPPEPGRYHLFVNYACGWSARVMLVRSLKGLQDCISLSHTSPMLVKCATTAEYRGWALPEDPTCNGFASTFDVYNSNNASYGTGRPVRQLSVPILFDKITKRVVSNDSAQICVMLNAAFDEWAAMPRDLYPEAERSAIEAINAVVYPGLNDGVYRCRFAHSDAAYKEALQGLLNALNLLDETLKKQAELGRSFLCGEDVTLADVRTFPHLSRFDVIYRFNMLRPPRAVFPEGAEKIADAYPRLASYLEKMYAIPGVAETCDFRLAMTHYFTSIPPLDGTPASDATMDAMYDERKASWMLSRDALRDKRAAEKLHEGCEKVMLPGGSRLQAQL